MWYSAPVVIITQISKSRELLKPMNSWEIGQKSNSLLKLIDSYKVTR